MKNNKIKKAVVCLYYADGKYNEYEVVYNPAKTMFQNAREILREVKQDKHFSTCCFRRVKPSNPAKYDYTDDESTEFNKEYMFSANSRKRYGMSVDISFFE